MYICIYIAYSKHTNYIEYDLTKAIRITLLDNENNLQEG